MKAAPSAPQPGSIVEILLARAASHPEQTAYHFVGDEREGDATLGHAELLREAAGLAASLQIMGLQGQPVLLACKSNFFFVIGLYACLISGALQCRRRSRAGRRWNSASPSSPATPAPPRP
ncbi:MAG: hypothetical protein ABWY05_05855 [Noviherbaspirillum sp.]